MILFGALIAKVKAKMGDLPSGSQQMLLLRYLFGVQFFLLLVLCLRLIYLGVAPIGMINIPDQNQLSPWFQLHVPSNKGFELPIFFVGLFICCWATWFAARILPQLLSNSFVNVRTLLFCNLALFVCVTWLFFPGPDESILSFFTWSLQPNLLVFLVACGVLFTDFLESLKYKGIAYAVIFLCTAISLTPISLYNYSYVLEPAARILAGEPIRTVTSQYDLLLPMSAMPFLMSKWDLNSYKVTVQIANSLFYLWMIYELSKLVRKQILLLSALMIVIAKFSFATNDGSTLLQISFLRLDLWFPLVVLVIRYGLMSKSVLAYLLVMVLLSKTFGSVFALMYLAYVGLVSISKPGIPALRDFTYVAIPVLFCIAVSQLLLPNQRLSEYLQYQISFLQIAPFSFFWVVAPMLLFCAWVVFSDTTCDEKKDHGSRLLVFLCCGALVYFFGRSHEQNLLHVSTPFIFCIGLALERIADRFRGIVFFVIVLCGLLANDVMKSVEQHLVSFRKHGLSPYSAVAAGDFNQVKRTHLIPNSHDGKTLYCFPYSALEFYFHYHKYGNYQALPLSSMKVCGSILKKHGVQEYESTLKAKGFQLEIIDSGEI